MALIIKDRVQESSTTTGTGNFSLAGAYTGYIAFDDVMANGDTCYYCIEAIDANGNPSGEWETGLGTFNDTDTLVRTTVHASSNAGAAVNFSAGTKRVRLDATATYLSAGATFRGARAKKSVDQTGANYSAGVAVTWDTDVFDTDAFHDTGSSTSRMTIPSGVTRVRVTAGIRIASITAGSAPSLFLMKNGTVFCGMVGHNSATVWEATVDSGPIDCVATDYFEAFFQNNSDTSIDVTASRSFLAIEVLE